MSFRSVNFTGARWTAIVGVAALTIVVMALALLALHRPHGEGGAVARPVPSFTLGVTTPSPTPTPEASSISQPNRAEERFLSAGREALWRGVAGECGVTDPLVERSDDGGATWTDVTPRYLGIGQVLGMSAFSAVDAEIVAAVGPSCEIQALRTYTNGEFWEPYPEALAVSSYIDITNPSVAILAGEAAPVPCPAPTGLRTSDDNAALICDGVPWIRSGADWIAIAPTRAATLTVAGSELFIVHAGDACEGITISRVTGIDWSAVEPVDCAADANPAAASSVATLDDDLLLWSGEALTVRNGVL